jgi:SAM-dependent methyltransferase
MTAVGPDNLPLPPDELIVQTVGGLRMPADDRRRRFFRGGARTAALMKDALERHGSLESCEAILDFGCGCGRVVRHLHGLSARLYGCDRNPAMVAWCEAHLPFAAFTVNDVEPDLPYESGSFNLIYGLSVFTHLPAELQVGWTEELSRVLTPGGILLVTLAGESRIGQLDAERQATFRRGQLVVTGSDPGSNQCSAYHPKEYVMSDFSRGFDVLEYVPDGAVTMRQDLLLLRSR